MKWSSIRDSVERAFPIPEWVRPLSAGVDISDTSIKWMVLGRSAQGIVVRTYGTENLEPGIVKGGSIIDGARLTVALSSIAQKNKISSAHAALPEESAFVFSMHVPTNTPREQVLHIVEFELEGRVPLPLASVVFDYDVIGPSTENDHEEIGVVAFPKTLSEGYAEAFLNAGIVLESLEIEARSIARAVCDPRAEEAVLLIDYGLSRTGLAVVKNGIPLFTSTTDVGGDMISKVVMGKLAVDSVEAQRLKNDEGLLPLSSGDRRTADITNPAITRLGDEIARAFRFWDTRKGEHGERITPLSRAIMVGGSTNLRGVTDYLASRIQTTVERGNVWRNVCSFDSYIPVIDRRTSLQYASALGLALRSFL